MKIIFPEIVNNVKLDPGTTVRVAKLTLDVTVAYKKQHLIKCFFERFYDGLDDPKIKNSRLEQVWDLFKFEKKISWTISGVESSFTSGSFSFLSISRFVILSRSSSNAKKHYRSSTFAKRFNYSWIS